MSKFLSFIETSIVHFGMVVSILIAGLITMWVMKFTMDHGIIFGNLLSIVILCTICTITSGIPTLYIYTIWGPYLSSRNSRSGRWPWRQRTK